MTITFLKTVGNNQAGNGLNPEIAANSSVAVAGARIESTSGSPALEGNNAPTPKLSDLRAVPGASIAETEIREAITKWANRSGLQFSPDVLILGFLTWTRLHGIISLELGGHLAATGIGAPALFEAEVGTIRAQATKLPRAVQD